MKEKKKKMVGCSCGYWWLLMYDGQYTVTKNKADEERPPEMLLQKETPAKQT